MKKTFYIFLCMLLGVVLLLIIERALLAIYIIGVENYPAYDLLTSVQLQIINWGAIIAAVVIGLLYGNYLGHHWYPLVYGEAGSGKQKKPSAGNATAEPVQKTVTVKPVRVVRSKVSLKSEVRDHAWDFDDLINHDMPAVESLGSAAPAVASAVSLGEPVAAKPKRIAVRKTKAAVKAKPAKKPAAKTASKSGVKVKVK